jgi:hypothetical protein
MLEDWLLCDLHIHTNWSDGTLPLEEVIDLFGQKGVDVISITDHIVDSKTLKRRKVNGEPLCAVEEERFSHYIELLWRTAEIAWKRYKMLLIPGVEITNDSGRYHIVAIDIKEYVDPNLSVEEVVARIHAQGAIAIACHPHHKLTEGRQRFLHLWKNHMHYDGLFDAWEVANRDDLFNVVGLKKFNYIANSDFHEPSHFYSWKTLIGSEKNTEAIKAAIRENKKIAIYLFRKEKPIG